MTPWLLIYNQLMTLKKQITLNNPRTKWNETLLMLLEMEEGYMLYEPYR